MKARLLIIFALVLSMSGTAWGESLVDIKVEQLSQPQKPRWGSDPFVRYEDRLKRPELGDSAHLKLNLKGIISDGKRALAIINNGFYRKGDIIGDFVIGDILSDRVLLLRNGKSYTLSVEGFAVQGPGKEAEK
jgi:hypothetical protein